MIVRLASRDVNTTVPFEKNYFLEPIVEKSGVNNSYNSTYSFKPAYSYSKSSDVSSYIFRPLKMSVTRVPHYSLGTGVLGRTWTNTGIVEILDSLHGNDFEEVLMHEILHNIYPSDPEWTIRDKTRDRMWFDTKWN
ncbi:MAG: hypothetical protein KKA51_07795 [Nanoarchaeota archaeon]|nr:hypothetical protein [Nanoarchaeota archaeon]